MGIGEAIKIKMASNLIEDAVSSGLNSRQFLARAAQKGLQANGQVIQYAQILAEKENKEKGTQIRRTVSESIGPQPSQFSPVQVSPETGIVPSESVPEGVQPGQFPLQMATSLPQEGAKSQLEAAQRLPPDISLEQAKTSAQFSSLPTTSQLIQREAESGRSKRAQQRSGIERDKINAKRNIEFTKTRIQEGNLILRNEQEANDQVKEKKKEIQALEDAIAFAQFDFGETGVSDKEDIQESKDALKEAKNQLKELETRSKAFKEASSDKARVKVSKPEERPATSVAPTVSTQAEFDALPSGATYREAGNPALFKKP